MAINGILEYGGFYNNYKVVDIPKVDIEDVNKEAVAAVSVTDVNDAPAVNTYKPEEPDNRSRMANLEDISLNFNTGDDYSYIGSESSIGGLDMQKAISDMKKDKMLEDYQFFVGSADNLFNAMDSEDGKVFLKF